MTHAEISFEGESSMQNGLCVEENPFLSMMALCGEIVFSWLCLDDLVSLNSTCKQMKQQTGEYFQEHYPWRCIRITQDEEKQLWRQQKVNYRFAAQFRYVTIEPSPQVLNYMSSQHNKQVHCLKMFTGQIAEIDKDIIARITKNVKIIEVWNTEFDGELYECLLKHCKQMEHLIMKYEEGIKECTERGTKDQWQLQAYPSLKHFCLLCIDAPENLEVFFRLNPNIRTFRTSKYVHVDFLLETGISFDDFYLDIGGAPGSVVNIVPKLNQLYEREQYKRLILNIMLFPNVSNINWTELKGLYGLACLNADEVTFEALMKLNKISLLLLYSGELLSNIQADRLAKNFHNLEEIYLRINDINQITPFICHAVNIKKIHVHKRGQTLMNMDIVSLNKERKKLKNSCKVEIYLPDTEYFQLKWKLNKMNYDLIEIKHIDEITAENPFVINEVRTFRYVSR